VTSPRLAVSLLLIVGCTDGPSPNITDGLTTNPTATQDPSVGETSATPDPSSSSDPSPTTTGVEPTTTGVDPSVGETSTSDATTQGPVTLEPSTTTADATTTTASTTDDTGGAGECEVNADCASLACLEFRDFDPQAACVAAPGGGATRFPGTILDFVTGAPVPQAEVGVVGALSLLTDPQNAEPILVAVTDANGEFDAVSKGQVQEGIGVFGLVGGGKFFLTGTGLAAPAMGAQYGPMSTRHDVFAMPAATLTAWSNLLQKEPALADALPLGQQGGVIGLVRDAVGAPVAGAVVVPVNDGSSAEIRYLGQGGDSFNANMTAASGVFVILKPGLAEKFEVEGQPAASGQAASGKDLILAMTLDLP